MALLPTEGGDAVSSPLPKAGEVREQFRYARVMCTIAPRSRQRHGVRSRSGRHTDSRCATR
jgi:hypothetical protein